MVFTSTELTGSIVGLLLLLSVPWTQLMFMYMTWGEINGLKHVSFLTSLFSKQSCCFSTWRQMTVTAHVQTQSLGSAHSVCSEHSVLALCCEDFVFYLPLHIFFHAASLRSPNRGMRRGRGRDVSDSFATPTAPVA